jgi:hypothetical protein
LKEASSPADFPPPAKTTPALEELNNARARTFSPGAFGPLPPFLTVAGKIARVCDAVVANVCRLALPPALSLDGDRQLLDWTGRRGGVELVRVVKHGCLGCAGAPSLVVPRHGVQQLRSHLGVEPGSALLDQAQPEVDMTQ